MMATPKRKRTASLVPQIDTVIDEQTREAEPESPRSKVASNLLRLQIHDSLASPLPVQPHISKKRHLQDGGAADLYEKSEESRGESMKAVVTPPKDRSPVDAMDGVFEIGETPGAYNNFRSSRFPSSPPISPSPSPLRLDSHGIADSEEEDEIQPTSNSQRGRLGFSSRRDSAEYRSISHTSAGRQARSEAAGGGFETVLKDRKKTTESQRRKSKCGATPITTPPPPTPMTSPGEGDLNRPVLSMAAARVMSIPTLPLPDIPSLSSPPAKKRKSPPLAPTSEPFQNAPANSSSSSSESMTWSEKEITGHLWNPDLDLDDDGEGINGIGFRPTAAIEWKRREGRKRQISDWRAREAKEERKRRFERRKRGSGGSSGSLVKMTGMNNTTAESANSDQGGKRAKVRFAEAK